MSSSPLSHRPVTRSQTAGSRRDAATKREAARDDAAPAPKRKQQRRAAKRTPPSRRATTSRRRRRVDDTEEEDAAAAPEIDQSHLEAQRQKDLQEETLLHYEQQKAVAGGVAMVWGDGSMGQLGIGEDDNSDPLKVLPVALALEKGVVDVAAGGMHTLMLMEDGSLQSFGSNDEGALGRKTVGDVWGVDEDDEGAAKQSEPAEVHLRGKKVEVQGISCTDSACFAWTKDGRIYGWGSFRSSSGLIGFSGDVSIQKLPVCIYRPSSLQKRAIKVATGGHHVLALLKNGSVLSWGDGERGQLGRGHPQRDGKDVMLTPTAIEGLKGLQVQDVYCGEYTSFFKTVDGRVLACGLNNSGQLGIAPLVDPKDDHCPTIASSVKAKALFLEPTEVESLTKLGVDVKYIASGKRHTLVLTSEGQVYSFGSPMYGALGRLNKKDDMEDPTNLFPTPEKIPGLEKQRIQCVAAGQDCSVCIDEEGRMWRFGGEHSGLICVGWDGDDILLPEVLEKGKAAKTYKFLQVEFGGQHGVLLGQKRD